jgi:two-component system nitrate/nitrite response regulator NarL
MFKLTKCLFIDDHEIVLVGISHLLSDHFPYIEISTVTSVKDALNFTKNHHDIDLILTDLGMPGIDGMSGLQILRKRCPQVPIIVFSASLSKEDVLNALEAGAAGYVPKMHGNKNLIKAIEVVMTGGIFVPREILNAEHEIGSAVNTRNDKVNELSARQQEVLEALSLGYSNKEVGRNLNISEGTVKAHINQIFRTLGVKNRTEAVVLMRDRVKKIPSEMGRKET